MSYLKNYKWLLFFLVSVSLILIPVFVNYADAAIETNCTDKKDNDRDGKIDCADSDCASNSACITCNLPVMIEPDVLNSWINNGYNNGVADCNGYSKMVVISAVTGTIYAAGHPTGSYLWDSSTEMRTQRSDGVLPIANGVLTKPMMNTIFSRAGYDNTKVVVLIGDDWMQTSSAYFSLRYWGVPKKQLRVVNGLLKDYKTTYTTWNTTTPAPAGGTYEVCQLPNQQMYSVDETRATLTEMMNVAKDNSSSTVILDVRNQNEYDGQNTTWDTSFSGRIRTAKLATYTTMITNGSPTLAGAKIKTAAELSAFLTPLGAGPANTHYVHCRTGLRAGVGFLAIDAVLGWKVKKFEDSWIVWGNLSDEEGILSSDSKWRTNTSTYSEVINAAVSTNKSQTIPGYGVTVGCSYAAYGERVNANDKLICGTVCTQCICYDPCVPFTVCPQTYDCKFNVQ